MDGNVVTLSKILGHYSLKITQNGKGLEPETGENGGNTDETEGFPPKYQMKSRELVKKRLNTMQPDNCFNTLGGYNDLILLNFNLKGENTMRIILDTEKGRIILPQSFFPQLDKMNKILADSKADKKWTAEDKVVK